MSTDTAATVPSPPQSGRLKFPTLLWLLGYFQGLPKESEAVGQPTAEVGLASPGKSGKGLGQLSAPVRLTCFVVAPSPHLGPVGWAQETWVQTSALGALVSKQAEWAHSERVHTKAPDQHPSAMLASSILDLLVAVSPLVHNLWEVVGAEGASPQPEP